MARAEPEAPTSVLDTSALMALPLDEEGKTVVAAALAGRSAISIVNWAEVLSKAAERGLGNSGDRIWGLRDRPHRLM